jgi:hypothetical protein
MKENPAAILTTKMADYLNTIASWLRFAHAENAEFISVRVGIRSFSYIVLEEGKPIREIFMTYEELGEWESHEADRHHDDY